MKNGRQDRIAETLTQATYVRESSYLTYLPHELKLIQMIILFIFRYSSLRNRYHYYSPSVDLS